MSRPASVLTRAQFGLSTPQVTVETHLPGGLPGFTLVGLPETAVREARDRVKSALGNCGFEFPSGKVVVNLAPADLVKEGARFDLPIAISILCATGQLSHGATAGFEFLGELGLEGDLRAVRGGLCAALAPGLTAAGDQVEGFRPTVVLPAANALDAIRAPAGSAVCLAHLRHITRLLQAPDTFLPGDSADGGEADEPQPAATLDDVRGQLRAKRALLIAAAGGHHLLMVGPPGTGKTLLARCLPSLLPPLPGPRSLEVAAIYSAAGFEYRGTSPPFREPHHSASAVAMAGGGPQPRPGEITLAHAGVLFLDEIPHFKPSVLDLLREPLANGRIVLARARYRSEFPAAFQLVAAMNPCPAGRICSRDSCRCAPARVRAYQGRISGPLLDRIDLQIYVPPVPSADLLAAQPEGGPNHVSARRSVAQARARQHQRQGCLNADLPGAVLVTRLDTPTRTLLTRAADKLALSARSLHKILRVARTIADLKGCEAVRSAELTEALGYRNLDWEGGLGCSPQ